MTDKNFKFRRRMMALANGGHVRGPGSGTSDSVPARLSDGEFVLPADTVRKVGVRSLRDLVATTHKPSGKFPRRGHFADGGMPDDEEQKRQNSFGDAAAAARDPNVTVVGSPASNAAQVPQGSNDTTPPADAAQIASDRAAAGRFGAGFVSGLDNMARAAGDIAGLPVRGVAGALDTAVVRPLRAAGVDVGYLSPHLVPPGADPASMTPFTDQKRQAAGEASAPFAASPAGPAATPAASSSAPSLASAEEMQNRMGAISRYSPAATGQPAAAAEQDWSRSGGTNAQVAQANPQGVVKARRGADGTMEFSGGNVSGPVSYADADGKALPGGGIDGKGFSDFRVAPAGANVAMGTNGSYAFAERGNAQQPSPVEQRSPVGMTVEQAQREGLIGERVGYDPRFDQRLNGAGGQNTAAEQGGSARARLMSVGGEQPQAAGIQAPVVRSSLNDWQMRNELRNAEVSANSIMNNGGRFDRHRKGVTPLAVQKYRSMLEADKALIGGQSAADVAAMREGAGLKREGMQQTGANTRAVLSAEVNAEHNRISRDRLAMEQTAAGFKNSTAQRVDKAQRDFENAKTPEEKRSAREWLMALMGKTDDDVWAHSPGGQVLDPKTSQLVTQPGVIYNRRTGQQMEQPAGQAGGAAVGAGAYQKGAVYTDANGRSRRWDGTRFVPI